MTVFAKAYYACVGPSCPAEHLFGERKSEVLHLLELGRTTDA